MGHLEPSIIWLPFAHAADAQRVELRTLGREASRAAFRVAAAAWQAEHGPAAWAGAALANDEHGAPHIAGHVGAPLISITHTRGLAGCAIAIPGAPAPGIDAEPLDSSGVSALRALAEETGEARHPWKDDAWPLRLWCAKESVVKAERFGADALGRTKQEIYRVLVRLQDRGYLVRDEARVEAFGEQREGARLGERFGRHRERAKIPQRTCVREPAGGTDVSHDGASRDEE